MSLVWILAISVFAFHYVWGSPDIPEYPSHDDSKSTGQFIVRVGFYHSMQLFVTVYLLALIYIGFTLLQCSLRIILRPIDVSLMSLTILLNDGFNAILLRISGLLVSSLGPILPHMSTFNAIHRGRIRMHAQNLFYHALRCM